MPISQRYRYRYLLLHLLRLNLLKLEDSFHH